MVDEAGFAIGNHTWAHADLTTLTDPQVRALDPLHPARPGARRGGADVAGAPAVRRHGRPGPARARADGLHAGALEHRPAGLGRREHPADRGAGPRRRTTAPHQRRAPARRRHQLPRDATGHLDRDRQLRRRGFCFADLDAAGAPTPPVPVATVRSAEPRVAEGARVRLTVRLDRPTTRPTTVRLTAPGTALPAGRAVRRRPYVGAGLAAGGPGPGRRARRARGVRRRRRAWDPGITTALPAGGRRRPGTGRRTRRHGGGGVAAAADGGNRRGPVGPGDTDHDVAVVAHSRLGPARTVVPAGSRVAELTFTVPVAAPRTRCGRCRSGSMARRPCSSYVHRRRRAGRQRGPPWRRFAGRRCRRRPSSRGRRRSGLRLDQDPHLRGRVSAVAGAVRRTNGRASAP